MSDITKIFAAFDELIDNKVKSLRYDITIRACIVDASKATQGEYIVDDGSSKFTAYSDVTTYKRDNYVYVNIPRGDYTQPKMIIGKYLNTQQEYYTYVKPSDSFIDITDNIMSKDEVKKASAQLIANGDTSEVTLFAATDLKIQGYTRLLLKGSFTTWLKTFELAGGNYGLRLDVISYVDSTMNKKVKKTNMYSLDSSEMYGAIYNFEAPYEQEVLFDITDIGYISDIRLVAYQNGNFTNGRELIDPMQVNNIFIEHPSISFGYDIKEFKDDKVLIYTNQSQTFAEYLTDDLREKLKLDKDVAFTPDQNQAYIDECNTKEIQLRWIKKNLESSEEEIVLGQQDFTAIADSSKLPESAKIHWYRWEEKAENSDDLAGPFWKEIDEARDSFSLKFIPNSRIKKEKIKALIEYPSREYLNILYEEEYAQIIDGMYDADEVDNKINEARRRYDAMLQYWTSDILEFTNESDVPDYSTIDLISGLSLEIDKKGLGGVYHVYNETGEINARSEASKYRIITANYYTTVSGTDADAAEAITWIFPTIDTMIESPTPGIEYDPINDHVETFSDRIEITRYGVQPTAEPGQIEIDSTQQYFRIKDYYSQNKTNNSIICRIVKNNRIYESVAKLNFGTHGTMGTNFTAMLRFVNRESALLASNGYTAWVEPIVYDADNVDITAALVDKEITYSWYSQNTNKDNEATNYIQIAQVSGMKAQLKVTTDNLANCRYYILKCVIHNVHVMRNNDSVEPIEMNLVAYLPIAVKHKDYPRMDIDGANLIRYDTTGSKAVYYNNPYKLISNEYNKQAEMIKYPTTWKMSFGPNTKVEKNSTTNKDGLNFYPSVTSDGVLAIPTPYMSNTGTQVAVDGTVTYVKTITEVVSKKITSTTGEPQYCPQEVNRTVNINDLVWTQPLLIYQDSYGSPMLNSWDGKLTIDEKNGTILSTMIGAGVKNADNTFSGVLMGKVSGSGTGLYGYHQGIPSFGLKVDGTAFFGKSGKGRICIDGNNGYIESEQYNKSLGMRLDLNEGTLTSKYNDARVIIDPKAGTADKAGPFFLIRSPNNNDLMYVGTEQYILQSDNYKSEASSGVQLDLKNGTLKGQNFKLEAGGPDSGRIIISSSSPYIKIKAKNHSTLLEVGEESYYLQSANTKFQIDLDNGTLTSTGDFTIGVPNLMITNIGETFIDVNGKFLVNKDGSFSASNSKFSVSADGEITATGGTIGGWTIGADGIYNTSGFGMFSNGEVHSGGLNGNDYFKIDSSGNVTIGGWKFTSSSIHNSNTYLYSTGKILLKSGTHEFSVGNGTDHPYASGLNVGSGGIAMGGHGISGCTSLNVNSITKYNADKVTINDPCTIGGNLVVNGSINAGTSTIKGTIEAVNGVKQGSATLIRNVKVDLSSWAPGGKPLVELERITLTVKNGIVIGLGE